MKEPNGQAYVQSATHQSITTIEFYHPQSNSLPSRLLEDLAQAIHSAGTDAESKVIVLRSGGQSAFCAGASFDELSALNTIEAGIEFFSGFGKIINEMRKCPKFIIARIHGKSVGGAVGLVAAADYAIAMHGADVKLSELSIGIGPFVVAPAIERKMGLAAFSHLAIDTTLWRSADWAKRKGLFAELHPEEAGMDESIDRLATALSQSSPDATKALKKDMWRGTEDWDQLLNERAKISARLALSEFTRNSLSRLKK